MIWCIWYEIHAIIRYIQQEFIKQSFDQKEITPNCLLISINCSSLRGFVKISASWYFVLTNSSVMSPFCAWSGKKMVSNFYMLSPKVLHGIFWNVYCTSVITFNSNMLKKNFEITKCLFHPKNLCTTQTNYYVFGFRHWQGYRILLLTIPWNKWVY